MITYQAIIQKISEVLGKVDEIQQVFAYPLGENENIGKYPCAIFFPEMVDNSYDSVLSNRRTYRFKLFLLVKLNATNQSNIFTNILPSLVDSTISQFDADWSFGDDSWQWIDTGRVGILKQGEGKVAFFEGTINIVTITT